VNVPEAIFLSILVVSVCSVIAFGFWLNTKSVPQGRKVRPSPIERLTDDFIERGRRSDSFRWSMTKQTTTSTTEETPEPTPLVTPPPASSDKPN